MLLPPYGLNSYELGFNGMELLYEIIIEVCSVHTNASVLVVGDLNAKTGNESAFIDDDTVDHHLAGWRFL